MNAGAAAIAAHAPTNSQWPQSGQSVSFTLPALAPLSSRSMRSDVAPHGEQITMPTKSNRINVVVTDRQHALLSDLAAALGTSASKLVREAIVAARPVWQRRLALLLAANEAHQDLDADIRSILDQSAYDQRGADALPAPSVAREDSTPARPASRLHDQ